MTVPQEGKQILLFLGSGASVDLGTPTMAEMVRQMLVPRDPDMDLTFESELVCRIKRGFRHKGIRIDDAQAAGLLEAIQCLRRRGACPVEIEALMQLLADAALPLDPATRSAPVAWSQTCAAWLAADLVDVLREFAFACCNVSLHALDTSGVPSLKRNYEQPLAHYRSLIAALITRSARVLEIATTNWDVWLEAALNAMAVPFVDPCGEWTATTMRLLDLDAFRQPPPEAKVRLSKVNGSVSWALDDSYAAVRSVPSPALRYSPHSAVMVYPGEKPDLARADGPTRTRMLEQLRPLRCEFAQTLELCSTAIVIGFSFPETDQDMRKLFRARLDHGAFRLVIVDPKADAVRARLGSNGRSTISVVPKSYEASDPLVAEIIQSADL